MADQEKEPKKASSKSPRAPAMPLEAALKKTLDVYAAEELHPVPVNVAAKHLGYKNANNGASLTTLASLRYFGLLERPKKGMVKVSSEVQRYKYSPNESEKREILMHWLLMPDVFSELYDQYGESLPSLDTIRYSLIQGGFRPNTASSVAQAYIDSLEYVAKEAGSSSDAEQQVAEISDASQPEVVSEEMAIARNASVTVLEPAHVDTNQTDKIVVRLSGGRRAWLILPTELYSSDKERIKAQVDVIVADDED